MSAITPMNQTEIIAKLQSIFDEIFLDPPRLTPTLTAKEVRNGTHSFRLRY